jgi:L-lactate dehydrogenase complex protein LldG
MSSARERILGRIRQRKGKPDAPDAAERAVVLSHLSAHPRSPVPRDTRAPGERFRERAQALASTVAEAATLAEVPVLVARYLADLHLPMRGVCWEQLRSLDWLSEGLDVQARAAQGDDLVGITGAFCGIAETGTLMTLSSGLMPPSVSLLPETHIAVLHESRIVRTMEDAWLLLRTESPDMPRAVSFISGPSRTADIEQTVTLGAHGPYRVHIVVVSA